MHKSASQHVLFAVLINGKDAPPKAAVPADQALVVCHQVCVKKCMLKLNSVIRIVFRCFQITGINVHVVISESELRSLNPLDLVRMTNRFPTSKVKPTRKRTRAT